MGPKSLRNHSGLGVKNDPENDTRKEAENEPNMAPKTPPIRPQNRLQDGQVFAMMRTVLDT